MKKILWIDMEMTGLNDATDTILEVAAAVTDLDFNPKEEFHRIVFQQPEVLDRMDEWCRKTHKESGLTDQIAQGLPMEKVEEELLAFIDRNYQKNQNVVIAGNTVGNDKRFIERLMPKLGKRLHYRIIDVSSFKEIFRNKYGVDFEKKKAHRAVDDVKESIEELKAYLKFVTPPPKGAAKTKKEETKKPKTEEKKSKGKAASRL